MSAPQNGPGSPESDETPVLPRMVPAGTWNSYGGPRIWRCDNPACGSIAGPKTAAEAAESHGPEHHPWTWG